ncbi:hypothetical protein BYT27DRAFT_7215716 [Phlegmacium glaucopus]|nr:hypothetical protein BYT27DRAFT_7215716 [Phlegmacium glaucopus]
MEVPFRPPNKEATNLVLASSSSADSVSTDVFESVIDATGWEEEEVSLGQKREEVEEEEEVEDWEQQFSFFITESEGIEHLTKCRSREGLGFSTKNMEFFINISFDLFSKSLFAECAIECKEGIRPGTKEFVRIKSRIKDLCTNFVLPVTREEFGAEFCDKFSKRECGEASPMRCNPISDERVLEAREDADNLFVIGEGCFCIHEEILAKLVKMINCSDSSEDAVEEGEAGEGEWEFESEPRWIGVRGETEQCRTSSGWAGECESSPICKGRTVGGGVVARAARALVDLGASLKGSEGSDNHRSDVGNAV